MRFGVSSRGNTCVSGGCLFWLIVLPVMAFIYPVIWMFNGLRALYRRNPRVFWISVAVLAVIGLIDQAAQA
jgi:hypothetical protein